MKNDKNNTANNWTRQNKTKIIVTKIFSWGFLCLFPCSHSEQQPTPASPVGPHITLGRSVDLLWALWGQLTLICPISCQYLHPKSTAAKFRLVSVVGTLVYSYVPWKQDLTNQSQDLIYGLCSCMERFPFLFLSCTIPGAQLLFWPPLCMWATLSHLFPTQVRGSKSSSWLGYTYSLRSERDMAATTEVCMNCLQHHRPTGSCKRLGCTHSGGSPTQCPQRQGLSCGGGPTPCLPLNNGTSFPR